MTLSPKKYVSNFTSTTTNRGVEAKETEIANTRLDMELFSSVTQDGSRSEREAARDETGSYIQVVVHKAVRARTSSPVPAAGAGRAGGGDETAAERERDGTAAETGAVGPPPGAPTTDSVRRSKKQRSSPWRKLGGGGSGSGEYEPAQVLVYGLELGPEAHLAAHGDARRTRVEAAAARWRWGRAAGGALDEALGAAALAAGAPLAALVRVERRALGAARAAVAGVVRAAADEALTPALALAFDALLRPALVWAGRVCAALRRALQPLWGALGDALEPAARLLAAARLVDVHVHYAPPPPSQH